jgi:hypothetical protein
MRFKQVLMLFLFLAYAPVWAETAADLSKPKMRGWGLRVGLADDPDQVVAGVHFDLGEIVEHLRLQPNIELGVGDNHTTLFGTGALHYRFDVNAQFRPYAGGGLTLGFIDHDHRDDDTDFEIGLKVIGGIEWRLKKAQEFFLELNLGFGDIHDAQVFVGWTF